MLFYDIYSYIIAHTQQKFKTNFKFNIYIYKCKLYKIDDKYSTIFFVFLSFSVAICLKLWYNHMWGRSYLLYRSILQCINIKW